MVCIKTKYIHFCKFIIFEGPAAEADFDVNMYKYEHNLCRQMIKMNIFIKVAYIYI